MLHQLGEVSLGVALRSVGIPASRHRRYQQRDECNVFHVARAILRRAEQHDVHGFDGYLLTVNGILDAEHVREVLHIIHREPKAASKSSVK